MDEGVERRLAAILAADVVGYSRLMEADEAGTHARLKALRNDLIDPAIARHKGRIVKLTGDGALVEFPSAVGAVLAAAAIQRAVAEHEADRPGDERLTFRIGINLGDVIIERDDIYGDGVNVAARLEGLAEPGGICVARTVYNQVKGKVDFGFAPAGEHRVKNISEPVTVYRALLDGARWQPVRHSASWRRGMIGAAAAALLLIIGGAVWTFYPRPESPAQVASDPSEPLKLPSKPSIAVLPFANLSDDAEQEYFVDGLVNDIITDLSKFSTLFVIAGNSTFQYKDRAVNVRDVARDLGVRYVLEGSVQRADDILRVNAQLIDATTGTHVWAERYDRPAEDFFAVQNDIARNVVGIIYPLAEGRGKLQKAELERISRTPTENLEAYDYFLQGVVYMDRFTREDNARSREMFEKAIELDPGYARAITKKTWTYLQEYWNGWTEVPDEVLKKAMEEASRAIAVDPNEPLAHYALASVYLMQKRHDLAISEFQRAYELSPNDATLINEYGWGLTWAGRAEEGIPLMQEAMRLNPYYPEWYLTSLADGYFVAARYEEMIATLEKVSQPWSASHRRLMVGYAHLGRLEDARAVLAKYRALEPQASIELLAKTLPFKRKDDLDRFLDGLRKAGLPETSPKPGV
jgi:TolB-like protein/class 3 adenylate cyclase